MIIVRGTVSRHYCAATTNVNAGEVVSLMAPVLYVSNIAFNVLLKQFLNKIYLEADCQPNNYY